MFWRICNAAWCKFSCPYSNQNLSTNIRKNRDIKRDRVELFRLEQRRFRVWTLRNNLSPILTKSLFLATFTELHFPLVLVHRWVKCHQFDRLSPLASRAFMADISVIISGGRGWGTRTVVVFGRLRLQLKKSSVGASKPSMGELQWCRFKFKFKSFYCHCTQQLAKQSLAVKCLDLRLRATEQLHWRKNF